MRKQMARRVLGVAVGLVMTGLLAACGGDDGVTPDARVTPFVGTWEADSLTITNDANPTQVANVLTFGSFFITVEPSGQYTASLTIGAQANPEIGQLSVLDGSTLTLTPTTPAGRPAATSAYVFASADYLILDGPTEFDFNGDEEPEPSQAHIELRRQ
jgi:hypothetical protein